jgi:hypothetical protein
MAKKKRPLQELSTAELRAKANDGLEAFGAVLEELTHRRKKKYGRRLFAELGPRRPAPGRLAPPDAKRSYSVYVIQLDPGVVEQGKFRKANPQYVEGMPCYYVGMTAHTPGHRFAQHRAGENSARFVADFGRRLVPEYYHHRNPLTRREARIEERALALELREQGYGVWQN